MCVAIGVLLRMIKGLEERLEAATEASVIEKPLVEPAPAGRTLPAVVHTRPTQGKVQPAKHKHTVGLLPTAAVGRGHEGAGPPVFPMEQIGTVLSPFPHRAGTPRQGTRCLCRQTLPLRRWVKECRRWVREASYTWYALLRCC